MTEKKETKGRADNIDRLVSKRLKNRRMMLGLSQYDLSIALEVSIQQVQKYENGTNRVSSGKLFAIAKLLKVPVSYFFEHAGDKYIDNDDITEREIVALIKAFIEIKNAQSRKKITELVRTMV